VVFEFDVYGTSPERLLLHERNAGPERPDTSTGASGTIDFVCGGTRTGPSGESRSAAGNRDSVNTASAEDLSTVFCDGVSTACNTYALFDNLSSA
jgi:hypothetical protein